MLGGSFNAKDIYSKLKEKKKVIFSTAFLKSKSDSHFELGGTKNAI